MDSNKSIKSCFKSFKKNYKPFVSDYETQFKYYEKNLNVDILEYCDSIIYSIGDEVKYSTTKEYKETMELYNYYMKRLYEVYTNSYPWWTNIIDIFDLSLFRNLIKIDFFENYIFDEQIDLLIMPDKVAYECLSPSICYLSMIIILSFKLNIKLEDIKNIDRLNSHCFVFRDYKGNPKIVSVYEMINIICDKLILRYNNINDIRNSINTFIDKTFCVTEYKSIIPCSDNRIIKNINFIAPYTKIEELHNYYIVAYKKNIDSINYNEYENDYNIINTCIVNVCRDILNKDVEEIPIEALKGIAKVCNFDEIYKKWYSSRSNYKQKLFNLMKRFYPKVERHFYII